MPRCRECGAQVSEEQYCPRHRCCWECDDECFPPEEDDDEEDALFDADELGLDPEQDDVRGYGKDAALVEATVNLTLFKLGLF